MFSFDPKNFCFFGEGGTLKVDPNDKAVLKLAMLIEGECGNAEIKKTAKKYGYTKQRYYQIYNEFHDKGIEGLVDQKRGPKGSYKIIGEVERKVIRYMFLDPKSSAAVISQKLKQSGCNISARSVLRVIKKYGLEKKTLYETERNAGNKS